MNKDVNKVLVLDFGSQYNQLIVRRIREKGIYSLLVDHNIDIETIKNDKSVKAIVFSGGPDSCLDPNSFDVDERIYDLGLPILGICYGMQLTSKKLGGTVTKDELKEYGETIIKIEEESLLYDSLPKKMIVWMSHGDRVIKAPESFIVTSKSENGVISSLENKEKNIYLIQYHLEVRNTNFGYEILDNFLFKIAKIVPNYSMNTFIEDKVKEIKEEANDQKVLLGISGGVDSSVVAALVKKAIGNNLTCMFINHGLLRKNEVELVQKSLKALDINLVTIDASEKFLKALKDVEEPEEKRKIIGKLFVDTFKEESKKLGKFDYLAQGTLYTDVIESGTKTAKTIKSHHNVGGLPKELGFKLIEPLRTLFKDEVRDLGLKLGLPSSLIHRQPFPGPGLAIRIIGNVTKEKIKIVQDSDAILQEEIKNANLDKEIWQYFTVLSNVKSVGVKGDERSYEYMLGIRAVTSIDGMTANFAHIPYDVLTKISSRIVNEVKGVNRVTYDITQKPPSTIEWE